MVYVHIINVQYSSDCEQDESVTIAIQILTLYQDSYMPANKSESKMSDGLKISGILIQNCV